MTRNTRLLLSALSIILLLTQCDDKGAAIKIKGLRDEIDELNHQNAKMEDDRRRIESQIDELKSDRKKMEEEKAKVEAERAASEKRLEELKAEFERYKQQYKLSMQKRAPGMKIEDFATVEGKTFSQVVLKEISDSGIYFTHSGGIMRLTAKQLPESMQATLGFLTEAPKPISTSIRPGSSIPMSVKETNLQRKAEKELAIDGIEKKLSDLRKRRLDAMTAAERTRESIRLATIDGKGTLQLKKQLDQQELAANQLANLILQLEVDRHGLQQTPLDLLPEKKK